MIKKEKLLQAYKDKSIGINTLIELAGFNHYIVTIKPDGEVLLENE